jgi:hypothetical protein
MPGQTPACAPVPHAMPPGQVGQSSTPPQPLPMRPQYWPPPIGLHVIGVQFVGAQTPARRRPRTSIQSRNRRTPACRRSRRRSVPQ